MLYKIAASESILQKFEKYVNKRLLLPETREIFLCSRECPSDKISMTL